MRTLPRLHVPLNQNTGRGSADRRVWPESGGQARLALGGETEQVGGGAREPGGGVWFFLASL